MYYRRKVLLALLETFGGSLGKTSLQKLLFLFSEKLEKPIFDFVPYQYGCYSYQSVWDLGALSLKNFIEVKRTFWQLKNVNANYISLLKENDQQKLTDLFQDFNSFSSQKLLHFTYLKYPYYATKSKILKKVLSTPEITMIKESIEKSKDTILHTIGYEGISLETYLNKLIKADVKLLCDVRKNPFSQKFGFSKDMLSNTCKAMGIKYLHLPALGIQSEKRQNLKTQTDYDLLFMEYATDTLPEAEIYINEILILLKKYKRIALTCFEAHHCQCHRGILAKYIIELPESNFELKHL